MQRDIVIGAYRLTTDHPASSYDIPVLVDADGNGYGPSDIINEEAALVGGPARATGAWLVDNHIKAGRTTRTERVYCRQFLAQWPDGPQGSCDK